MKVEKIEKHMSQNTVVFGHNAACSEGADTIGVIERNDGSGVPLLVRGIRVDLGTPERDGNWYKAKRVRKATDEEIARFFAWLREDGRDIANGFERFGGRPPKGFEVAATTTAAAPEAGRVYDRNAPEADIRALVGQTVEIIEATPSYHNGKIGRVLETSTESYNIVRVEVEGVARGWWASKVRVVSAAPVAETKPALTQKARYEVGDRVQLRAARSGESRISPTFFVPGSVVTILSRNADENKYDAVGTTAHGGPHNQTGLKHADIAGLAPASAPTATPGKVYNGGTPRAERDALVGKRVRYLDRDLPRGQAIGVCAKVDGTSCPYLVRFDNGDRAWSHAVELVEGVSATETRPVAKRLTVGDKAVAVHRTAPHIASIGTISRDDHDSLPYLLDGKAPMYREENTFPLTVEGFRGAHAVQKAEGVVPENGDFVATFFRGAVKVGVLNASGCTINYTGGGCLSIDGGEDLTDRVVVLCKAPRI